ncbi:Eukaryotic translation initiation factor 3 subunit E-B [Bienertia sinuspersici]
MNYEYSLIKDEIGAGVDNLNNTDDDPLAKMWKKVWKLFWPRFMSLNEIDCSGPKMVRVSFSFSNASDIRNGFRQPLDPNRTLIAEGAWNVKKSLLSFVACRILNFTLNPLNATIGDCSIRINFTFSDTLSIRDSSVIKGHVWSKKNVDEPGYFDRIEIHASGSRRAALPDMKYVYTEIDRAKKYCDEKKVIKKKGKSYPDPFSQDMKFNMEVRNNKGKQAWGKAYPVYVGDSYVQDIYPYFHSRLVPRPKPHMNVSNHGLLNVTYRISFSPKDEFKVRGRSFTTNDTIRISAEGIYDTEAGHLCMVGCWNLDNDVKLLPNASKLDCETFVNVQFPPRVLNVKAVVKGTIESKREKSDPLYFDHLDLSATSLTKLQVDNAFWRLDFEIAMVLISNTLACIFVGLQLFHVKRNPDALPFISIAMLVVITLGHMIPLLLNMEALFLSTPTKKTMLFGSGGWLEVNEVLVRVITMVAFLLEGSPKVQFPHINMNSNPSLPFWRDMKSYAGFILDAFLLPQIVFNMFTDSKARALAVPYYIGTTLVRLLPHAYDLFRAHSSTWSFDPWYIYANPGMNYYSTTWDILISCRFAVCHSCVLAAEVWWAMDYSEEI